VPENRGKLTTAKTGEVTGQNGVYAGGDCASGPATVIKAIMAGKIAAANLDVDFGFHTEIYQNIEIPEAECRFRTACGRSNMRERPPLERAQDFEGVEYGLTQQEIAQECSRCLRCDHFGYGGFRGGRQTW